MQYRPLVLCRWDFSNFVLHCGLQSLDAPEASAPDVFLHSPEQPKVTGSQIGRVRGVGQSGPAQDSQEGQGVACIVGGGIIHMDEFMPIYKCPWMPPGMCSIKPSEDTLKHLLVYSHWALYVLIVYESLCIKESHQHHFCSKLVPARLLRAWLCSSQPLLRLDFEVRVIYVDPRLIHCNCVPEDPGSVRCQSEHETGDSDTFVYVLLLQDMGYKNCTLLDKFQIQFQDPVYRGH